MLLPAQPGPYPDELVAAGKQGTIYVINRDNMGKFHPNANNIVQELDGVLGSNGTQGGSFDTPAYFGGDVYYAGVGDDLEAFQVNDGLLSTSPSSESANAFQYLLSQGLPLRIVVDLRSDQRPDVCGSDG